MQNIKRKGKPRQQPSLSYAYLDETSMNVEVGKDFDALINAPLSRGGHFIFKSEKNWSTVDYLSEYSELFTLNLNILSTVIDCIPFNEYVNVDNRYFISDQLTSVHNDVERGKAVYNDILDSSNRASTSFSTILPEDEMNEITTTNQSSKRSMPVAKAKLPSQDSDDNLEDDIDFLLSLTEPVQNSVIITQPLPKTLINDSRPKMENVSTKPIDLEKWLDLVLDD